jgi:hypothetical protein
MRRGAAELLETDGRRGRQTSRRDEASSHFSQICKHA